MHRVVAIEVTTAESVVAGPSPLVLPRDRRRPAQLALTRPRIERFHALVDGSRGWVTHLSNQRNPEYAKTSCRTAHASGQLGNNSTTTSYVPGAGQHAGATGR